MTKHGEVLIAIIEDLKDFAIAREQHWYRIPITSVEKWMGNNFPPEWLAFYQTKDFGEEGNAVNYIAKVKDVKRAFRYELFPNDPQNEKSHRQYHQIFISKLQPLPRALVSKRKRRIHFIPTTIEKFKAAEEINDLFDESPLEDILWKKLKDLDIPAERQEFVDFDEKRYALDFAIYCKKGKIDIEADGDYYHTHPEEIEKDKHRANDLETKEWHVLRFTSHDIHDDISYCLDRITKLIDKLGGLETGKFKARKVREPKGTYQPSFFDFKPDE